ncbi:MAG: hydrogenase maturation nickel metallochaperone HypA, partial [Acidobacteria bacterium]|nr:hydrogenase maturation nickel metallochaperone HypA [Acidobacteriota bacterium]
RQCREAVADYGPGRLDTVHLAIGELSAVEPELMSYAWEAVTVDTPDAESSLKVRWCPAIQRCSTCGVIEGRVEGSWLRLCPNCSMALEVTGGDELDIESIQFTTDDDGEPS